ncbi:MAG: RpiB/LacA/LacB family sugar-phosphate isomerase, partial [Actinobacteria bacterium]|nr:RpiB/LacA/LacB family sugar-phosphate isomerase [Actinomycetota bacterium]
GALGHTVIDHGTNSTDSVDYPQICADVARSVRDGKVDFGIVLGGSGQGEQIAANKVRGVRAALCNDLYLAEMTDEVLLQFESGVVRADRNRICPRPCHRERA